MSAAAPIQCSGLFLTSKFKSSKGDTFFSLFPQQAAQGWAHRQSLYVPWWAGLRTPGPPGAPGPQWPAGQVRPLPHPLPPTPLPALQAPYPRLRGHPAGTGTQRGCLAPQIESRRPTEIPSQMGVQQDQESGRQKGKKVLLLFSRAPLLFPPSPLPAKVAPSSHPESTTAPHPCLSPSQQSNLLWVRDLLSHCAGFPSELRSTADSFFHKGSSLSQGRPGTAVRIRSLTTLHRHLCLRQVAHSEVCCSPPCNL